VPRRLLRFRPRGLSALVERARSLAIDAGTIHPRDRRAARFAVFGEGSIVVFPTTALYGEQRIEIGRDTMVGPLASISVGMPSQADDPGPPVITIGDRCLLGKGIGIVAHQRVEIGDDVFTGHYVYITDQNHGYEDLDEPIGTQMWTNAPVRIGPGSWLGHGCVILPGTILGAHTVVAAAAVVRGTYPDNCVLGGVPARVLRHHDGTAWVRNQA
jgi:acetyltransferase-like isoleucine patch superfamily enzyme